MSLFHTGLHSSTSCMLFRNCKLFITLMIFLRSMKEFLKTTSNPLITIKIVFIDIIVQLGKVFMLRNQNEVFN